MACSNFGIANDFNVFLFSDVNQINASAQGRVAAGGNVFYQDYSVATALPISTTLSGLIIGGSLNIIRGTNTGNTIISSSSVVTQYTMNNLNGVPGQPFIDDRIDFAEARLQLRTSSADWAAMPVNGTVENRFGTVTLIGSDPVLNLFTFDGANVAGTGLTLSGANGVNMIVPDGSFVAANIRGNNIGFGSYGFFFNGIAATPSEGSRILWNVPDATSFTHGSLMLRGSILAPFAVVTAQGSGQMDGQLIAEAYNGNGMSFQQRLAPFGGCLPETIGAASLTVSKTIQGQSAFTGVPGTTFSYIITATNTGQQNLTNVLIEDEALQIRQTIPLLVPGENFTLEVNSQVPDGFAGTVISNTVRVVSDQTALMTATATVTIAPITPIIIQLSGIPSQSTALPGDLVDVTYALQNFSNVILHNVRLVDPQLAIDITLAEFFEGDITTGTLVIPANAAAGSVISLTAALTTNETPGTITATVEILITDNPSFSLEKLADIQEALSGDTIEYTIRLMNDSSIHSLNDIVISDPFLNLNSSIDFIPPGSSVVYHEFFTIPPMTPAGESFTNTVSVNTAIGNAEQSATVVVRANPELILTNDVVPEFANPGSLITFTIIVRNLGNTVLTDVRLVDTLTGLDMILPPIALNDAATIIRTYSVPLDTPDSTVISNTASASSPVISTVALIAAVTIITEPVPPTPPLPPTVAKLTVSATSVRQQVFPGDSIIFTGAITNESPITIRNIVITAPLFQTIGLLPALLPGQTTTLQGRFVVNDKTPPGTLITANLTAASSKTPTVEATVSVEVLEKTAAELNVTVNQTEVIQGERVTFTGMFINKGNVTLVNVLIKEGVQQLFSVLINMFSKNAELQDRLVQQVRALPGTVITGSVIVTADNLLPIQSTANYTVYGLLLQLAANRNVVQPGETVTITLQVTNPNSSIATEIVINGLVPSDTIPVPGSVFINGQSASANQLSAGLSIGTIEPAQSRFITYQLLIIDPFQAEQLTIQAAASFFFPLTRRLLRGVSQSQPIIIVVEESEE